MKTPWLASLLCLTLVLACSQSEPAPQFDQAYWKQLSYLHQDTIHLVVTNQLDSSATYWVSQTPDYHLEFAGQERSITLPPGETDTLRIPLMKPAYLLLASPLGFDHYVLLPRHDRALVLTSEGVQNVGTRAPAYTYLDRRLLYLVKGNRWPDNFVAIDTMLRGYHNDYVRSDRQDTTSTPQPPDLVGFVRREAEVFAYARALHLANYLRYIGQDTLPLSDSTEAKIVETLRDESAYFLPSYINLFREYAGFRRESREGEYSDYILTQYADHAYLDQYRADGIANWIDVVCNASWIDFDDQARYHQAFGSLPESYENALTCKPFGDRPLASAAERQLRDFFATPFPSFGQDELPRPILNLAPDRATLYKFWFVGCRPCIRQQPYEQALLDRFPDLDIVYICHSSAPDDWRDYHRKLPVDVTYSLYVPTEDNDALSAGIGRLGAPLYTLIGKEGQIICHDCPNPSGDRLGELIAGK